MYKIKVVPEEKIRIVQKAMENKQSMLSIAKENCLSLSTLTDWVRKYSSIGATAFSQHGLCKRSHAEKEAAVLDYLSDKGTIEGTCEKYKIKSTHTLREWIKKYNSHEKLKASGRGAEKIMTKGRKTTFEERVEIVQYCIAKDHDYIATAEKYHISYQQARNYTVKYEAKGVVGLRDRRGLQKPAEEMTELEKLRAENKILRAEKEHAEMEASFLKKLAEIERRRGLI